MCASHTACSPYHMRGLIVRVLYKVDASHALPETDLAWFILDLSLFPHKL